MGLLFKYFHFVYGMNLYKRTLKGHLKISISSETSVTRKKKKKEFQLSVENNLFSKEFFVFVCHFHFELNVYNCVFFFVTILFPE